MEIAKALYQELDGAKSFGLSLEFDKSEGSHFIAEDRFTYKYTDRGGKTAPIISTFKTTYDRSESIFGTVTEKLHWPHMTDDMSEKFNDNVMSTNTTVVRNSLIHYYSIKRST